MPGRFKAFHYYNVGAVFDALMALFKPMLSKKMQDRVRLRTLNRFESMYALVCSISFVH